MLQKRMFKVISPVERKDGSTWWMRCGNGFTNKDESINVYLDAVPVASKDGSIKLQLRELTEEELRERSEKRASYSARNSGHAPPQPPPLSLSNPTSDVPF